MRGNCATIAGVAVRMDGLPQISKIAVRVRADQAQRPLNVVSRVAWQLQRS